MATNHYWHLPGPFPLGGVGSPDHDGLDAVGQVLLVLRGPVAEDGAGQAVAGLHLPAQQGLQVLLGRPATQAKRRRSV